MRTSGGPTPYEFWTGQITPIPCALRGRVWFRRQCLGSQCGIRNAIIPQAEVTDWAAPSAV